MRLQILTPPDDPASLIADFGKPDFPGWQIIAGMLIAATLASLLLSSPADALRRSSLRMRLPTVRVSLSKASANGVRTLARAA